MVTRRSSRGRRKEIGGDDREMGGKNGKVYLLPKSVVDNVGVGLGMELVRMESRSRRG